MADNNGNGQNIGGVPPQGINPIKRSSTSTNTKGLDLTPFLTLSDDIKTLDGTLANVGGKLDGLMNNITSFINNNSQQRFQNNSQQTQNQNQSSPQFPKGMDDINSEKNNGNIDFNRNLMNYLKKSTVESEQIRIKLDSISENIIESIKSQQPVVSSEVQQQTSNIQNYEASNLTAQQKELFESLGSSYSDLFDNTSNSISDAINRQNQIIQALGAGVNRHVTITLNRDLNTTEINGSMIDTDLLRSQSDMFKQTLDEALKNKSESSIETKPTGQRTVIYKQNQSQNTNNDGVVGGRLNSIPNINTRFMSQVDLDNNEQSFIPVEEGKSAFLGSRKIDDISDFTGLLSQQQSLSGGLGPTRITGLTGGVNRRQTTPLATPTTNPLAGLSGGLFSKPKVDSNTESSLLSLDEGVVASSGLGLFLTSLFGKVVLSNNNSTSMLQGLSDNSKSSSIGLKGLADTLMRDANERRMADITSNGKGGLTNTLKDLFKKPDTRGLAKSNSFADALKSFKKGFKLPTKGIPKVGSVGKFLKAPIGGVGTGIALAGVTGLALAGAGMLAAKTYFTELNAETAEKARNVVDSTKAQVNQENRAFDTSNKIDKAVQEQYEKEARGEKVNAFGEVMIEADITRAEQGGAVLSHGQNRNVATKISSIDEEKRKDLSASEAQSAADILKSQGKNEYKKMLEDARNFSDQQVSALDDSVRAGWWDKEDFWLTDSEISIANSSLNVKAMEDILSVIDGKLVKAQNAKHTRAINALQAYRGAVNGKLSRMKKAEDFKVKFMEESAKYQEIADAKKLQESSVRMTPEENAKQMENDNMGAVLEGVKDDMSQSEYDYLKTQLESGDEESKRVAIETIKRYDEAKRNREAEQIPAEGNLDMVGVETAPEQTMMDTSNQLEQQDQMKREQEQAEKEEQKHKEDEQIQANKQLVESVKQVVENSAEQTKAIKETQQAQSNQTPVRVTTVIPPSTNNMPITQASVPT